MRRPDPPVVVWVGQAMRDPLVFHRDTDFWAGCGRLRRYNATAWTETFAREGLHARPCKRCCPAEPRIGRP